MGMHRLPEFQQFLSQASGLPAETTLCHHPPSKSPLLPAQRTPDSLQALLAATREEHRPLYLSLA